MDAVALTELRRPDYKKAKAEALRLLRDFGVAEPPINPVIIARNLGITVNFVEFADQDDNISGFFDSDDNAIFVNKDEYPLRQTFTVAHELGHKILHEEWAKSSDYRMMMRDQEADNNNPFEKEANVFARNLLVPRFLLNQYFSRMSVVQLSELFAVSVPVIKMQLSFEYGI